MNVEVSVTIHAGAEKIWKAITDFENCHTFISGIEKIEVLEKPASGLVGFKWRETRVMFGKEAVEVMWITEAVDQQHYQTRAESHGCIYQSRLSIAADGDTCRLSMTLGAEFQTLTAKILGHTIGRLFVGATKKALLKDLQDIKTYIEKSES